MPGIDSYDYKLIRCRRWTCDTCGPDLRLVVLRQALYQAVPEKDLAWSCTLTIPRPKVRTPPGELAKAMTKAFSKLVRRHNTTKSKKTKQKPAPLTYAWIKEVKNGRPHLHMFLPRSVGRRRISRLWHAVSHGKIVKFKPIDFNTVTTLVDYNTKDICATARRYGTTCGHWYGTSRNIRVNIDRPDVETKLGWEFVNGRIDFGKLPTQILVKDQAGYPIRFLVDTKAPPRRPSTISSRAAVAEGSEGAQPPLEAQPHAARAAGDDHAPSTVQP
jgi:hypothetical protein